MYKINNFLDNDDIRIIDELENIKIIEYVKDLSVNPYTCITQYYASVMNVRKRQAVIELDKSEFTVSAGAMQWMLGSIQTNSDIKGVGDFLGKAIKGSVTKEGAVKPKYSGTGVLVLEPTYNHLIIEDLANWGNGMVIDDGMFLGCESKVRYDVIMRSNLSSAVLGNQGLFSLRLSGSGLAILESPVPRGELIEIELVNDEIKIDGNFAIAWSDTLEFTVEKSGKSLIGSAVSSEGFVNVYRGTGKILLAPVLSLTNYSTNTLNKQTIIASGK